MPVTTRMPSGQTPSPLLTRLSRLASLEPAEVAAVEAIQSRAKPSGSRCELARQGRPVRERRGILTGWACRQRILVEGQRQILLFLLPGDLIGSCHHTNSLTASTIQTVTEVTTAIVPDAPPGTPLAEALARSAAFEEHYLVAQITRIGRLDAYQRIADWLLETCDRLVSAGLASRAAFPLPVTQELLADALGLTSVHVNRTLQALRRDGLITSNGNMVAFPNRLRLEKLVDYSPVRVSADG